MGLTFENLRVHYGTGRSFVISGTGRDRVCGYRSGIACNIGDIEEREWSKLAMDVVAQANEQALYDALLRWETDHNFAKRSKTELRSYTLELHMARIFDDELWVDFLPFNAKYRPERLAAVKTATVTTACCKRPGTVTQALLDNNKSNGTVCCPYCGRWSEYEF